MRLHDQFNNLNFIIILEGILYFFYVRHRIIVTNGFVKKTQKTPKSEIEKAKEYRKEYLERKEDNQ